MNIRPDNRIFLPEAAQAYHKNYEDQLRDREAHIDRLIRENARLALNLECSQDRNAELFAEQTRLKANLDRQGEMLVVYHQRAESAEKKLREAEFARDENKYLCSQSLSHTQNRRSLERSMTA